MGVLLVLRGGYGILDLIVIVLYDAGGLFDIPGTEEENALDPV